jgi:hypothetical protein
MRGVKRYFEFNVLPFGLSSAPWLFTKVMKTLVTHWRASGILIALYLDDGIVVIPSTGNTELDYASATEISKHVRIDLLRDGFIYNIEKSKWDPTTEIEWLGMQWDSKGGTLKVLQIA